MADVHTKQIRSYNMSRIRSGNTKPEMLVRKFLHSHGFRFRLHCNKLPGRPDIVLPKYKTAILVHGCFWHNHANCNYARIPASNKEYWLPKILRNIERDKENIKGIKNLGWKVIVVWDCNLKEKKVNKTFQSLLRRLT